MKKSTLRRIKERRNSLPLCFVDASVFVEMLFRQPKAEECSSFFHMAKCKYRLIASTIVMGEIVRVISAAEETERQMLFCGLNDIIISTGMQIEPVSAAALGTIESIRVTDPFLPSSDCIILSSAISENSTVLITLDKHFTSELSNTFHLSFKKPQDA